MKMLRTKRPSVLQTNVTWTDGEDLQHLQWTKRESALGPTGSTGLNVGGHMKGNFSFSYCKV